MKSMSSGKIIFAYSGVLMDEGEVTSEASGGDTTEEEVEPTGNKMEIGKNSMDGSTVELHN